MIWAYVETQTTSEWIPKIPNPEWVWRWCETPTQSDASVGVNPPEVRRMPVRSPLSRFSRLGSHTDIRLRGVFIFYKTDKSSVSFTALFQTEQHTHTISISLQAQKV